MAQSAAAAARRLGLIGAVRSVGDVLPFAIAKLLVIGAESLLLAHDENRGQLIRDEPAVAVEKRLAVRVLLHRPAFEQDDRAVGKIEDLPRRHGRGDVISVDLSDLADRKSGG